MSDFQPLFVYNSAVMSQFICSDCGYGVSSWYGRCPECGAWNTFQRINPAGEKDMVKSVVFTPFSKVLGLKAERKKTGVFEFDRVLGGGFVKGEVILVAGEPGVGKSTLILKVLESLRTIYISGEESAQQIKHRADRIKSDLSRFHFSDNVQVEGIIQGLSKEADKFEIIVVDSIQTVHSKDIPSPSGSLSQIKEAAARLADFAKKKNLVLLIVGHITKEGDIAGPKTLEHLVDCVLYLEGDRQSQFRILRSRKNRFGPTDEVGVFEMGESGLNEVKYATAFLETEKIKAAGKAVVGISEGSRPLFFEVQSLVVPTVLAVPRRVVSGVDYNKVQLILAVLRKNLRLALDKFDIYVNVVGGVTIKSTGADLGVAASIISSVKNIAIAAKTVFIGEVGLLGEIRQVMGQEQIIKEAKRYEFIHIYSPKNIDSVTKLASIFA